MVEFGKDSNVSTNPAVRGYRRVFFYSFVMIWIRLHILPEYVCLPTPLAHGTVFTTLLQDVWLSIIGSEGRLPFHELTEVPFSLTLGSICSKEVKTDNFLKSWTAFQTVMKYLCGVRFYSSDTLGEKKKQREHRIWVIFEIKETQIHKHIPPTPNLKDSIFKKRRNRAWCEKLLNYPPQ